MESKTTWIIPIPSSHPCHNPSIFCVCKWCHKVRIVRMDRAAEIIWQNVLASSEPEEDEHPSKKRVA